MPVIAGQGSLTYLRAMPAILVRLLTLLALVLMPLGMTAMPAAAHASPAAAAGEPCADHDKKSQDPVEQSINCTVSCAALPALSAPEPSALRHPGTRALVPLLFAMDASEPEMETPPPKLPRV